ncbi:hypothetical protein RJ640_003901 [Escallonia rubra]|uniref:Kinesin-like protein n=1 Tax=Escallonia rubra TaxID=112253 RepID=A0AA88QYC7_9ASTE|nr:hypothetical protein RJ640_003901 [Escallonia rubra]
MEDIALNTYVVQTPETLVPGPSPLALAQETGKDSAMEVDEQDSAMDYMVCDSGSRLVPNGFTSPACTDEVLMFVNAGGEASVEAVSDLSFLADQFFQGGDIFLTDDLINEAGDYPFIYQSARLGNFCYRFENLPPGDYYIDLHFVEIINIYGPKGMRVFNVFIQDEKVLSDFDIFSIVGANKPLQLVDSRVSVKDDGLAKKVMRMPSTAKYEKKIQDLSTRCQQKTDECYQAWMSLTAANEQLEKIKMELDNKLFQTLTLDQTVEKQAEKLRNISSRYERDKKFWVLAVNELEQKMKTMKQEHSELSREAHECADSIPELNKMILGVQALVAQCEDLKVKYSEEQAKRRKLHNQVEEAKGNIRVFCRCRPLSKAEASAGYSTVVDFDAAKDGELGFLSSGSTKKTFKFDRVYTPKDDQGLPSTVDVFADASPMATSVLDGYNVCIFAYGQTGTGKTFTMEGTEENRGVNYRTLEELFRIAKERAETFTYNISVSVVEVYNEQIRDLLATSPSSKNMLCITVKAKNLMNGECTKSKLWLVDLAGSERLAKTDVQGDRLKEAQNINRSLSALGDVISALATKNSHIPYRNSKLTHLLQDSLGGDSKTLMFVQISPSENDLSETLSSLNFATRVRGVELGPARKQVDTSELQKMKMLLDKAKLESRFKDECLRKLEESLQNAENKVRGKDQIYKNHQEKIKELEGQLELKAVIYSQSEKQLSHLSEKLKGSEEVTAGLQQKVRELEDKLKMQAQESRSHSVSLEHKVKDLERKLEEQKQNDSSLLHQKIKELEEKFREQDEHLACSLLVGSTTSRSTPPEGKRLARDSFVSGAEHFVLRSSNSTNRQTSQGATLLKGNETLHDIRRKRLSRNSETENFTPNSLNDNKGRQSDPPKPFARVTRTVRPVTTSQRPVTTSRTSAVTAQGNKERENKKRMWSR